MIRNSFLVTLFCATALIASACSGSDTGDGGNTTTGAADASTGVDAAGSADVSTSGDAGQTSDASTSKDTTQSTDAVQSTDATTPTEDTVTGPEDVEPAPEDVEPAPEDTVTELPPGCSPIADLVASEEGPVELTLCEVAVTMVYYNGYYVQEAGGDAMNIYVGGQLDPDNAWPYPAPQVGDVLSIPVTEYGSFAGHQEVLASEAPTVTGTTTLDAYYTDLSAGTLPTEDSESSLVTVSAVTIDDVEGKTLKVSYGTATDVQVYLSGTIQVCEGATMTITTGIITEYDGTHQIKVFEPDTDIADLDMTGCVDETYNWDFEDWSESDPPVNFVKTDGGDGFQVTQETTNVHGGSSAAHLTIITKESVELAQTWYMDLNGATSATFSLWIVENDPNLKSRLVLKFYDGTAEVPGEGDKYSAYSDDSADWTQLTVSREVPEGATQVRAFIRLYDENDFDTAGSAAMIIDDWNLAF